MSRVSDLGGTAAVPRKRKTLWGHIQPRHGIHRENTFGVIPDWERTHIRREEAAESQEKCSTADTCVPEMTDQETTAMTEHTAKLTVAMLSGVVDPLKFGPKVYVKIRLQGETRLLSPVSVDPAGEFAYHGEDGVAQLKGLNLEAVFNDHLYIILCSWDPSTDWTDAAQIVVPVRTIEMSVSGGREFRSFVLEPIADEYFTDEASKPSLTLSVSLQSPFRPPVEMVSRLLQNYGSTVDYALDTVSQQTERVAPIFSSRAALVPAIPMGVFVLASVPLACVFGVVGLPFLAPILVVVAAVGSVCALLGGAIWAGSRRGRSWVQGMIQPVCDKVGREDPEVLYPIGPRPSPARILRSLVPTTMWPKLAMSLLVDFIGCTSYAVPILGEMADVMWAPIAFLIIDAMYRESSPWAGWFGALEEILPFTDIIPTATLAWMKEYIPVIARKMHATATHRNGAQRQSREGGVYDLNGHSG